MSVVPVPILENSNWVQTYGDKYKTFDRRLLPTVYIPARGVDNIQHILRTGFSRRSGVGINLVIQPAVFGDRQNNQEGKEAPESSKGAKGRVQGLWWLSLRDESVPHHPGTITEEPVTSCLHLQKTGGHYGPTPQLLWWNPGRSSDVLTSCCWQREASQADGVLGTQVWLGHPDHRGMFCFRGTSIRNSIKCLADLGRCLLKV